jgi:hypothetical protein
VAIDETMCVHPRLRIARCLTLATDLFHVVELARQLFLEINGGELNLDCSGWESAD